MSCNGCRVLRKGCSDMCPLRTCLHWIPSPQAQAHATLFLAKFFGRSDLFSFISSVPHNNRPELFQSLLYEACGRTINPVNGAVGLLSTGNWHLCEAALRTVLAGGVLTALPEEVIMPVLDDSSASHAALHFNNTSLSEAPAVSVVSGEPSEMTLMSFDDGICSHNQRKLLNLFV